MQKLSKRLLAVAGFVTDGNRVADIGTDHAYLPIYLVQSGRCPGGVAMDIRPGPLARAQEHIERSGLEKHIQTRLSDGMQKLNAGEVDCAVVAGMGGLTVIHILEDAAGLLAQGAFKELVLEPQSDIAKVRKFLRGRHMDIDKEDLVYEDGKYYPILDVDLLGRYENEAACLPGGAQEGKQAPTEAEHPRLPGAEQREMQALLQELQQPECVQWLYDQYGAYLIGMRHPLLYGMLERDGARREKILKSLDAGRKEGGQEARAEKILKSPAVCRKGDEQEARRQELAWQLDGIRRLQAWYRP